MNATVQRYIEQFLAPQREPLREIEEQYERSGPLPPPIGLEVGVLLDLLIQALDAQRVLEFGTALGFSTVMLARALGETGGRLVAVEADAARVADTRRNLEAAGLDGCVELVHGDASREIERLDGPFDLILQDAAKALYPSMLDACVERLRQRGILAADDGLFRPMGQREEMAGPIHAYNERVFADPRLRSTILPIGDGLTLSVRIR